MARRTAKHAVLSIKPTGNSLTFDDEEFPYDIAAEEIIVNQAVNGLATVTVTILVESVTVDADLSGPIKETVKDKNGWPLSPEAAQGLIVLLGPTTPEPPDYVRVLKDVDDKAISLNYLARGTNGKWCWIDAPDDPVGTGEDTWEDVREAWDNLGLTVVRVK